MEDARTRADGSARVVVIARDATRLAQYESALRVAKTPARATADPDAGADYLVQHRPAVLVLDQGLPRLALFRLYGLAREDEGEPPIQVIFVGQDDDTGPDDHYLPGNPSPSRVAVQVTSLLARVDAAERAARRAAVVPTPLAPPQPTAAPPVAGESPRSAPAASVSDLPPRRTPAQPPSQSAAVPSASTPAASANGQSGGPAVAPADQSAADAATAQPGADGAAAPARPTHRPGRRLDVILVRIGLVLLILGGLLFLLQMQVNQGPLVAPTMAPAAPTRRPSPSPSPMPQADVSPPAGFIAAGR